MKFTKFEKFEPIGRTEPMACCVHLTCKSLHYMDDERPGMLHESGVMTYRCLHTQNAAGPDNQAARPSLCQPDRPCFCGD